ncbi:hypothetical protein Cgig2_017436 [Carnegiea gigantea]|uniref:Phytocyanin domain-containing protein n=1 Tax=Carnegiea gigantea TaxID=171969 RepID=A0A9Q1K4E8_9CARY|nr:hypothetical protein Cgig2_017436 [Carnegiea gigantea]
MGMMKMCFLGFVILVSVMSSCGEGYKFYVGGRDGWVTHPSEDYNHWAQRMRFQYNKSSDSVLVVTKENYNTCNTKDPIKTLTEGNCEYKFERSGPYYFISGNGEHCKQGQKLIVVVLAVRPKKSPPKPAPVPVPAPAPVVSTSPASAPAPASQSPAPAPWTADSPAPAPAQERSGAPKVAGYSVGGVVVGLVIGFGVILDPLAFERSYTFGVYAETRLHRAVMLGRTDFPGEILNRKPSLASKIDLRNSTPPANNVEMVPLPLNANPEINPVHVADINGQTDVLKWMLQVKYDTAWVRTAEGNGILLLCVMNDQVEALELLENNMGHDAFISSVDCDFIRNSLRNICFLMLQGYM